MVFFVILAVPGDKVMRSYYIFYHFLCLEIQ